MKLVEDTEQFLMKLAPNIWRSVYTKHIDNPGSHYGNKLVSAMLALNVYGFKKETFRGNIACSAAILERHDYPIYFVSKPLIESMSHIHPPEEMKWADVFLPFPGLIFMLPKGSLFEPDGAEIAFLCVCRLNPKDEFRLPGTYQMVSGKVTNDPLSTEDRIIFFWATNELDSTSVGFPVSQKLEPDAGWIDRMTRVGMEGFGGQFSSYMAGTANLILVMSARSELVEHGARTKRQLRTGAKIHTPTWIGRKYAIRTEQRSEREPGSRFTELGWRSGYIRTQHYGPKNELTKLILIDPYIAYCKGLKSIAS